MIGQEERTILEPPPPPEKPPSSLGRLVGGALIVLVGFGWIADLADLVTIRWDLMLPAALIVVGLGIMYGATKTDVSGLVAIGVILSILVIITGSVTAASPWDGVGEVIETPTTATLETSYEHGVGDFTVDLRSVDLATATTVDASLGVGALTIYLPADTTVAVNADAGIGQVTVLGKSESGFGPSIYETFGSAPVVLTLDVSVGIGDVEVRR